jgi:hypothetical protein
VRNRTGARLKSALKANMAKRKAQAQKRGSGKKRRHRNRATRAHRRRDGRAREGRGQSIGQDRRYGQRAASGQIPIAGAKNACLTLMPATLLSDEPLTLTNAPRLSDIRTMSSAAAVAGRRGVGR